jgi:hypothetical protein
LTSAPDVDPYVLVARLAVTRDRHGLAAALAALESPPAEILDTLGRHTLIRQVLMTLGDGEAFLQLPDGLREALDTWRQRRFPSTARLLTVYSSAAASLKRSGVPVLLLKGFHLGERLYGGVRERPQFDIDLLVRGRDFRRASRVLEDAGFERHGHDAHSRTLRFDGVKLDLHRSLVRAPVFRADERAWWQSAITARAGGLTFRTLSDEWALVQLLQAAYEDIGQGMARLRQLVDLFMLVRDLDPSFDWPAFIDARRRESFDEVTVNVLALLTALFGAAADWPRLSAALDQHAGLVRPESTRDARALVFAPRKDPANLRWFASLYPGSLTTYLLGFWFHGFPGNLAGLSVSRLVSSIRLAARHRGSGTPGHPGG